MRFVPTYCIRENMCLGKTLYGKNGEMLLKIGTILNQRYIERIHQLGFNGIYIDDELSSDIELEEVISEQLKRDTVQTIKKTFIDIQKGAKNIKKHKEEVYKLVDNIVDEILNTDNTMVNIIDLKVFDDYTFYHCVNVATLSIILGVSLNLSKEELYKLGLAALFHDIGKVFIPKEILLKPGKLTEEEFEVVKTHSKKGYDYLKDMFDVPTTSYVGILCHHEKYNGTGYPLGKKGEEIPLFSRIISIADVYDALVSDRPYRRSCLPSEAMEYIMASSGSMFDPKITVLFTRTVAPYPIGTYVILSDKRMGIVVENYPDSCMRPKVKVVKENGKIVDPYELILRNDKNTRNIVIKGIVQE